MEDEIRNEAEIILNKAIQMVVFKYNAYAPIISSFRVVYSDIVPTMGVDKYCRLVVNPEFLVKNKAYAEGLVVHETLHIFMGHTGDTREKLIYTGEQQHDMLLNIAEDCAINQFISENLPQGAITVTSLSHMLAGDSISYNESAEYYFDKLMEWKKQRGENGEDEEDKNVQAIGLADGNSDCTDVVNSQEIQDKLDKMGIKHISSEEVNDRTMEVAKQISKSKGNEYGQLAEFAKKMLEPKVDWRPLLQATVRNAEKKVWSMSLRNTYKRTSKRSKDVLLPKKYGNKISVFINEHRFHINLFLS